MFRVRLDNRTWVSSVRFAPKKEVIIGRRGRTIEESAFMVGHEAGHIMCGHEKIALRDAKLKGMTVFRVLFPIGLKRLRCEAEAWRWIVRRIRVHRKLNSMERATIRRCFGTYIREYKKNFDSLSWMEYHALEAEEAEKEAYDAT